MQSLEWDDLFVLRFIPSQRHAHKKVHVEARPKKEATKIQKVVRKMKCRNVKDVVQPTVPRMPEPARASVSEPARAPEISQHDIPESSRSKRPREEPSQPPPSEPAVCCVHGLPCRHGCGQNRWADTVLDRALDRALNRLADDTSEKGLLARMAKTLFERMRGTVGSRAPSAHSRHSSRRSPTPVSQRRAECPVLAERHRSPSPQHAPVFEHRASSLRTPPHVADEVEPERRASSSHSSYARDLDEIPYVPQLPFPTFPELPLDDPEEGSWVSDIPQQRVETDRVGGRVPRPSQALRSPYTVQETPHSTRGAADAYEQFRNSGPEAVVLTRQTPPYHLTQQLFDEIEDMSRDFTAEVFEMVYLFIHLIID